MKNLLNKEDRNNLLLRIDKLSENDQRLWGKMNVNQMVCHITDPLRLAMKELKAEPKNSTVKAFFMKRMALLGPPIPKGKIETFKEIKQVEGGGTPPTNLVRDKILLTTQINKFLTGFRENEIVRHPTFGNMNKKQWGRISYIHMNHHLMQFGK
jgi:hypothetical protein